LSVVAPSLNQARFIEETIQSVLAQDYPYLEYIVIDGGSTDGTLEILRRYEGRLRWISEPDRGQADAINKGLRMAQGEVLAYLNSDDVYLPGAARTAVEYLVAHPEVGLVYGDCQVIDEEGAVLGYMAGRVFDLRRIIYRAEFIPQPAAFWRREVMDRVGMLDTSLRFALDYDFFVRVGREFPVRHIPALLACFRLQRVSKTISWEEHHWREVLMVSERYGMKPWTLWYWIRRLRHWGLRVLPAPLQSQVRGWLGRAQDVYLYHSGEAPEKPATVR
jgi:glycosyltransferase involved in cell wall biosynthesis